MDPPSPATVRLLRRHNRAIYCIAAAHDGRLVIGSHDGVMLVLSLATGAVEATLAGHTGTQWALCPLTDGTNRLLSGGDGDCAVRLHDLDVAHGGARAETTREYRGHDDAVRAIIELPDGRFASAGDDAAMRIWVLESGARLATLRGHTGNIYALAVVNDDTLVSGGDDETLRVWDTRTYAAVATIETPARVTALLRLTDGTLVSGHSGGVVRLSDWRRREVVGELCGRTDNVRGLAQLPDARLASASDDKTVRIWDVAARACVGVVTAPSPLHCCCVTADGGLAVGCGDGRVLVLGFAWARRSAAVVGWVAVRAAAYGAWA